MMQYILKSVLIAEIEKKIKQYEKAFDNHSFASYEACLIAKGKYRKLLDILQFINTIEVKEVDLEKIIEQTYHDRSVTDTTDIDHVTYENIAKYFFELGIKSAQ